MSDPTFIAISGGFDPIHIGHIEYINAASAFGRVIVLLNSDAWLIRKKGYAFMPYNERKAILEKLSDVHVVLPAMDEDGTVRKSIENLGKVISYFGKGGDRTSSNTPETEICDKLSIPILYGLGGDKIQSSSSLVRDVQAR